MSYEGYYELLCANGHYASHDCYETAPPVCGFCGAKFTHRHSVDQTNGICYPFKADDGEIYAASEPQNEGDEPLEYSVPAPRVEAGFDDLWKQDHHGNKYAVRVPRYAAAPPWRALPP